MAIGVVVGTAFVKIVDSFVSDMVMPPIGLLLGRVDFSNLYINLSGGHYRSLSEAKDAGAATINYGLFIETIIHFGIIALATYITILQVNRLKKAPADSLSSKECPYCLSNIPIRAVKCSHCTSDINKSDSLELEEELQIIENIRRKKKQSSIRIKINTGG